MEREPALAWCAKQCYPQTRVMKVHQEKGIPHQNPIIIHNPKRCHRGVAAWHAADIRQIAYVLVEEYNVFALLYATLHQLQQIEHTIFTD
jgi:hypothetical protein